MLVARDQIQHVEVLDKIAGTLPTHVLDRIRRRSRTQFMPFFKFGAKLEVRYISRINEIKIIQKITIS